MDCAGFLSLIILIRNFSDELDQRELAKVHVSRLMVNYLCATFIQIYVILDWYPSAFRVQKLNDSRAHFQQTSAHPPRGRAAYDRRAHSPLHLHTSASSATRSRANSRRS